jgi:hypothetical protein
MLHTIRLAVCGGTARARFFLQTLFFGLRAATTTTKREDEEEEEEEEEGQ